MPDMTPVADQIQPPNPMAGMNAYSNLLGIQQQRLALQTGQQNLATATAEAQQAQQRSRELQQAQAITLSVKNGAYRNPDGSLNRMKLAQDISALGPYAEQYGTQFISQANEMVANQAALNHLSEAKRTSLGNTFGALATNQNLSNTDVINALTMAAQENPQLTRMAISAATHIPANASPQQLRMLMRQYALGVNAPNASESAPHIALTQGPNGLQATQENPQSPLGIGPQGAPIPQGISPTVINNPVTNAPGIVHPGGTVTPVQPAGGQPPGGQPPATPGGPPPVNTWNPPPGYPQWVHAQTGGIGQRVNAAITAANQYPMAVDALTRARALLDQGTWTGGLFSGFRDFKNMLSSVGIDTKSAENMSELTKDLARYEAARASSIGDTDAARALTGESGPNTKFDSAAVHDVVLQAIATERAYRAYANVVGSAPTAQSALQREQALRNVPHQFLAYQLGLMRNKAETDAFFKRYNVSGPELAKSVAALKQLGAW